MKITKSQLKEIIKEEINEVYSNKQRNFMCAMKDADAAERPEGLSQDEAEEAREGPMKKKKHVDEEMLKQAQSMVVQYIQEELKATLREMGYSPAAGAGLRSAQLSGKRDEEEHKEVDPYERALEAPLAEEEDDDSFSKAGEEIEKKGTEGVFTAKAKKAGMGVQAYADKVLAKGSKASTKTKRQAAFAKGAATVARNRKK